MSNPSEAPTFAFFCLQRAKLQWSEDALRVTEVRDPEDRSLLAILLMVDRVDSTQDWLVQAHHLYQLAPHSTEIGPSIILLAREQTKGRGRKEHQWDSGPQSLTFSFSLPLSEVPTLTPLEVALQVCKSFEDNSIITLKLKWPNDLLNLNQEKVAGILCQSVQDHYQQRCIVGVGINLVRPEQMTQPSNSYVPGYIFNQTPLGWNELSATEWKLRYLSKFMLHWKSRLPAKEISKEWEARALYLNQRILYFNDSKKSQVSDSSGEGIFLGLGPYGEALVMSDDQSDIKKLFNESIRPIGSESH